MTSQRRGFNRERHTALKVGVTLGSVVAFIGGWIGFSVSNGTAQASTTPTVTPTAPSFRRDGGENPAATASPQPAAPTLPRARTSRGS